MKILFVAWRDLAHPKAGGSEVAVDKLRDRPAGTRSRREPALLRARRPTARTRWSRTAAPTASTSLAPVQYARRFRDVDLVVDVVNGLPFFSPLWRRRAAPRCRSHHVHSDQWGQYFPTPVAAAARLRSSDAAFRLVYRGTRFVTISPSTAPELVDLGIDGERVHLVFLGVDPTACRRPRRRRVGGAPLRRARAAGPEQAPGPAPRPLGPGRAPAPAAGS